MRKVTWLLVIPWLVSGCLEKSNPAPATSATILYRHHFLGTSELAHNTNYAKLPAIFALPASHELAEHTLQKLAAAPPLLWQKFLAPGAAPQPALLRPLLEDFFSAESYAEVHGPLQRGESVFAIELSDARAGLWQTNLASVLAAWKLGKPAPLTLGAAKGWQIREPDAPALIQFVRAGKWVLIGLGHDKLTLLPALLETTTKTGRPLPREANVALDLDLDCPRLGDWLPALPESKLPFIHLTLKGKGDFLRTEAKMRFSQPLPWTYEPWKIPTNIIRDPIISFTVARGIAPLLSQIKGFPSLGLEPTPNQFCAWAPATIHADDSMALPAANPSNALYQIGPKLPDFFSNLLGQAIGGFTLISNRNEIVWRGWPVLSPNLRAFREAGNTYLLGSLLPTRPTTNHFPSDLLPQIENRPNLAYYHWELTHTRLLHAKQLQQLWDIMNGFKLARTNEPGQKWLLAAGPRLENTITEATLSSPTELSLVRRSDLGFTGLELATIARWLANPGFPWKFEPPPPMTGQKNAQGTGTNHPIRFPSLPAPK
jgi:hypothetical protein